MSDEDFHDAPVGNGPPSTLQASRDFLQRMTRGRRSVDTTAAMSTPGDPVSLEGLSGFVHEINHERGTLHNRFPFRRDTSPKADPVRSAMARRTNDGRLRITAPVTMPLPSLKDAGLLADVKMPSSRSGRRLSDVDATEQANSGLDQAIEANSQLPEQPEGAHSGAGATAHLDEMARGCAQTGCPKAHLSPDCQRDFRQCDRVTQRLALPGLKFLRLGVRTREIYVIAEIEEDVNCCGRCGGLALRSEEIVDAKIHDRPIGSLRVVIYVDRQLSRCLDCGALTLQLLPATATRDMTDRLLHWIGEQSRHHSIESVAAAAGVASGGYIAQLIDARRSGAAGNDSAWGASSGWITPPQLDRQVG